MSERKSYSWIDGRGDGTIDPRDRGLHYGDGVFETMRVRRCAIRLLDYHLERLAESCRRLGFPPPNAARLRAELMRLAAARSDAVIKLIVTRGIGERGYRPTGRERCTRVISLFSVPRAARSTKPPPVRVRMCAMRLGSNPPLAGLKTLNRLESVLARSEWTDERIWEGLMRDSDDNIVCGTMSNVFLRQGARLITPTLDRCGISGVMRRWVLEQAGRLALSTREARVRWRDVMRAEEAFLTNAVAGIVPIRQIQHGQASARFRNRETSGALAALLEAE